MNSNLINNRDLHGTFLPQSLEAKTNLQSSLNPQINKDDNDAKDNFVSDNSSNSAPQRKKWLVMNYIAGDNSLKLKQLENIDHQELIGSDDQVDLTAFVDIGSLPVNFPLNESCYRWAGARTIHIIKDHSTNFLNAEVLEDHGREVDSSDWKNLKKFVVDMIKKYPADNVALIMNNHGTGFKGVLLDDEAGKFMQIPEIKRALTEAQEETGKKLDVIGFDACLMGELEVAYELKDVGNYMVASEETESTGGWCYIDILKGPDTDKGGNIANLSPLDFSKHIVNINRNNNCSIRTTSATDLNKIDGLKSAVDELAQSIIKSEDKEQIRKVFQNR